MHKLWIQAAMMLGGVIRGTIGGALGYLNTLLMSGFTTATKFHQEGIAFARELGMNAKEAQAYTEVLTERTERLAMKYGVAAEQVKELQRNISVATSRQLMLNDSQAEGFLQLNKLVGSSTVSKFTEEMMNGMGGQIDTVQGAVAKAYATAAKSGLNAQKVSEKIANNLNMANRLSFRTGIDGLTRMAMQAEKVGMNLSSIEGIADNFLEIDQAIENSARLQMLGGNAAIMGANPLDMAYEANYDPEALMDRVTKMARGAARFDAEKGIATVDPVMQDYLRNVAKTLGMSAEELVGSAKKQASNAFKEQNISASVMAGLTQEQKDFLINKSNVANGKTTYTTTKGETYDLTKGDIVPQEVLKEMMKYEGKSDREIMEENARSLSSINEILTGIKESITAMFGSFITGMFPEFQGDLKNFGAWAKDNLEQTAKNIGEAVRGIYNWFKENKEPIKTVLSGIAGFLKFATSKWEWLVAFLIGGKLWKMLGNAGIASRGASGAASAPTSIWGKARQTYKGVRAHSGMAGGTKWNALKAASKTAGKTLLKTGGVSLVGGLAGAAGNYVTDKMAENGTIEKGGTAHTALKAASTGAEYAAIGATIGSVIPGVGTGIGAGAGFIAGAIKGFWDAQKEKNTATSKANENKEFDMGGAIGGSLGEPMPIKAHGGEAVVTPQQFNKLFGMAETILATAPKQNQYTSILNSKSNVTTIIPQQTTIQAKPVGEKEYIYTPKNNETSNVNGKAVTVKDFNININGTLKLDGGSSSKNLDIRELLNDREFVNALKDVVKTAINNDINGGRHMNDLAVMSGLPAQTAIYGR